MEIPPPPGRRELSKQARRQTIVDAARRSFLEEGYAGTSMSALLKTLGGSKETLWGYFRSKEELFAAVIAEISATFRAGVETALTPGGDLEAGLLHFCRSFIERVEAPSALATWRLIAAESGRFPEVGRIFYENAARHTEAVLGGFLAEHVAHGRLRDEDPFVMARTLISLCVGRQTRLLWGVETADVDHPDAAAARYTDIFLRAYRS